MNKEYMGLMEGCRCKGRFAPSPSGRMHLGNIYTALASWLSAKKAGGEWLLRIEDLDPQRSKEEYAHLIEDDLQWLGLEWDEGGLDDRGALGPYTQSRRGDIYRDCLLRLNDMGLVYPCGCRRRDIMASSAPHQSDGRVIYSGHCRPAPGKGGAFAADAFEGRAGRLIVGDNVVEFTDANYGAQRVRLAEECGDFVLRRADGAWAYQLAVVADDALMGVTEVVRGVDLLLSTAQQIYIYRLMGWEVPAYRHLPLIGNPDGQRLSKRDRGLDMEQLRQRFTAEQLIGKIAYVAGWQPTADAVSAKELLRTFSWGDVSMRRMIIGEGFAE